MNGTMVTANNGVATAMILKKDQGDHFQHDDKLKTVNIYISYHGDLWRIISSRP